MSLGPHNYSYIFKYILIGDMGVGKSCLLHQFTEKKCKLNLFSFLLQASKKLQQGYCLKNLAFYIRYKNVHFTGKVLNTIFLKVN